MCRRTVYKGLYNFQQYILIFIEDFYLGGIMNKKGISPVIATVIIVAVAIAIAIAVAFWMTGIVGMFTGTVENVQIVAAIPNKPSYIKLIVKNQGTTDVTIDGVFVTPTDVATGWGTTTGGNDYSVNDITSGGVTISPGQSKEIYVSIGNSNWKSGVSIEIKIHTASGKEYPKLIVLP